MHERLQTIHKYYNNLEFNKISKKEALHNTYALTRKMESSNTIPLDRCSFITTLIKDNLLIFQSACEHVDTITNIIQILNEIDAEKVKHMSELELPFSIVMPVILHYTCNEDVIQSFIDHLILFSDNNKIQDDDAEHVFRDVQYLKELIADSYNEMILLQDADLYAVINSLMITRKFSLDKIWVYEPIKKKFVSLLKKKFNHLNFPIYIFRVKEELLTLKTNCNISITSIWSENIIAAKNLAFSLHKDIININTHMDYTLSLSEARMYDIKLRNPFLFNIHEVTDFNFKVKQDESVDNDTQNYLIYNPFYDGVWKHVNETYMICKGSKWARITINDIKNCIDSANEGFEIWNTMSFNSRIQVLSNFAFTLECNGKLLLASVISRLIQSSYLVENNSKFYEIGRFEITVQHKPIGFIFLKEKNEITLFSRLIQNLIAGNSVIVLCDANSCNLAPYCNMFATAEIPPGVINMLPSESLENLETFLFKTTYAEYIDKFFVKNRLNNVLDNYETFKNLCLLKKIVVAIK